MTEVTAVLALITLEAVLAEMEIWAAADNVVLVRLVEFWDPMSWQPATGPGHVLE